VVREVCLAGLAPVDLVGVEVNVVLESHGRQDAASKERPSLERGEGRVLAARSCFGGNLRAGKDRGRKLKSGSGEKREVVGTAGSGKRGGSLFS
jgi:hypothetical protein